MKTIPLTRGYTAIVSNKDYDYLNQYKWHVTVKRGVYPRRFDCSKKEFITMAKEVMIRKSAVIEPNKQITYKDRNSLNIQRNNLVLVDKATKRKGQEARKRINKSGYRGVRWHELGKKWQVVICFERRQIYIGLYRYKKNAAKAYDKAAKKYFGDKAILNLPE